jgi:selenocysteine lyase/cysteine desulfurase
VIRWPGYPRLYFNQAGSGPAAPAVRQRVRAVDDDLAALGGHSPVGLELAETILTESRAAVAMSLGLPNGWQTSFCSSATDALNLVASAVVPRRCRLVASDQEHPSGLLALAVQRAPGLQVDLVAAEPLATWPERLAEARRAADLVLVSLVAYSTGWRLAIERVPPPEDADGLLVVDVSQALGQVDLQPVWAVADAAVGLGHKWLHGPLPTGFVLSSPRASEWLRIARGGWHARTASRLFEADWRTDAARLEPGSMDVARVAGLAAALEHLPELLSAAARRRVSGYRTRLAETLVHGGRRPIEGSVEGMLIYPVDRPAREVAAEVARRGGAVIKDLNAPEVSDRIRVSICPLHEEDEIERLGELLALS